MSCFFLAQNSRIVLFCIPLILQTLNTVSAGTFIERKRERKREREKERERDR